MMCKVRFDDLRLSLSAKRTMQFSSAVTHLIYVPSLEPGPGFGSLFAVEAGGEIFLYFPFYEEPFAREEKN